jgi:Tol biopolymer transport system component
VKLGGPGTPLRLTTDPAPDRYPAWSPGGRSIAFFRARGSGKGEILLVPALGGPERRLTEAGAPGVSWSPDGKTLAFAERTETNSTAIFLLATDTGERRRLTAAGGETYSESLPAFSPDGRTLAFCRSRTVELSDIYLLALAEAGSQPRRVTSERQIGGLAWHPDGRSIIFSSNRGGPRSLWRISTERADAVPEALRVGAGLVEVYSPAISRQGALAFEQYVADTDIWRAPLPGPAGGGTAAAAAPVPLVSSTRAETDLNLSPDGKRLAFVSTRSGNREIWACDSEGSNPVQLTTFGGDLVGTPRWSADGRSIAFDAVREGHRDIYVIAADGGFLRRLTTEKSDDVRPGWSRDGRWIYFGSNRSGNWQVWKAPAQGGTAVQVTRNGGREALESPDGKFVYYAQLGTPGIWRVPAEGGNEEKVLDRGLQSAWAVASRGLYLLSRRPNEGPAVEFYSFATGQLGLIRSLARNTLLGGGGPLFAVSPDERWMLYIQADRVQSDILLVENWQ